MVEHDRGDRGDRGEHGDTRKCEQPPDREAGQRAERGRGIDRRSSGHIEAARDLDEAQREQRNDDERGEQDGEAVAARVGRNGRRHGEHAGAHDHVHGEREHVDATQAAVKVCARRLHPVSPVWQARRTAPRH